MPAVAPLLPRGPVPPEGALAILAPADPGSPAIPQGKPEEEIRSEGESYLTLLQHLHNTLRPRLYLEIGVRQGHSLSLAQGRAIGVDPAMQLAVPTPKSATLYHQTSDSFFERTAREAVTQPIDLAFIDGLHLFEYALRDFINIEQLASAAGLIVVDDIFPNHPLQASRFRRTWTWTGDVWRLMVCLARERPDLILLPLNCAPTGLLLIAGLNPANRQFAADYTAVAQRCLSEFPELPNPQLKRTHALEPSDPCVNQLVEGLRHCRRKWNQARPLGKLLSEVRGNIATYSGVDFSRRLAKVRWRS